MSVSASNRAQHSLDISQPTSGYRYNEDSIALSYFAFRYFESRHLLGSIDTDSTGSPLPSICNRGLPLRLIDIGSGCGILSLLLGYKFSEFGLSESFCSDANSIYSDRSHSSHSIRSHSSYMSIDALEKQEFLYDFLVKNVNTSAGAGLILPSMITPVLSSIESYTPSISAPSSQSMSPYGYAICNPPYYPSSSGRVSKNIVRRIACFSGSSIIDVDTVISSNDLGMNLSTIFHFCRSYVSHGGSLFMSYPSHLLLDAIRDGMRYGFELKRLQAIHETSLVSSSVCLLEYVHGAGVSLTVEPPLIKYSNGDLTSEYERMYTTFNISNNISVNARD